MLIGDSVTFNLSAQDAYGNVYLTPFNVTLGSNGSSVSYQPSAVVTCTGGTGTVRASSAVAQTINFFLVDTFGLGATLSGAGTVTVYVDGNFVFGSVGDQTVSTLRTVSLFVKNRALSVLNVVPSISLRVNGSASPTSQTVNFFSGQASASIIDNIAETVTFTIVDNSNTGYALSTQTARFIAGELCDA